MQRRFFCPLWQAALLVELCAREVGRKNTAYRCGQMCMSTVLLLRLMLNGLHIARVCQYICMNIYANTFVYTHICTCMHMGSHVFICMVFGMPWLLTFGS